ncbi:hypothetical protein GCWU000282_01691 [Catonella morbi ATCC 51271]|uniref:Uncharacterized protein n=1 Tax=Catonella morbi ATCC 51271 TaxID=592026 RepID=V2Y539_9FIRM|nr:hypothetical protein GCWU000282_01691 [Catonella morbi ATCC 51271]
MAYISKTAIIILYDVGVKSIKIRLVLLAREIIVCNNKFLKD